MMTPNWAELPFEERQRNWTGFSRQFRQNNGRGERPTVWEIRVEGPRIFTSHGLLGGARQNTDRLGKPKNVGRSNAITAEQDALAEARRMARKKWDFEGYDEYLNEHNIDRRNEDKSVQAVLANLPGSFCLYKPDNSLNSKQLIARIAEGKAAFTLKRNGFAHWVVVDCYGQIKIYSRRSRPFPDNEGPEELPDGTLDFSKAVSWNVRFPHLVEQVARLGLPPGSMLAVEIYMPRPRHQEGFKLTQSLLQLMTADALKFQHENGWSLAYVWDIPFYGGEDLVSSTPWQARHDLIHRLIPRGTPGFLEPVHAINFASVEMAQDYALRYSLEGFVAVDPELAAGDKGWNLKGKPDRPAAASAKIKPWLEDDFVVQWDPAKKHGTHGKGKHEAGKLVTLPTGQQVLHGGVGSVGLFQHNRKGELVYICDCASGMDYGLQASLRPESFPMVWEVQYTDRTYIAEGDDTNALTFPKLVRVRTDKLPRECLNERL